MFFFFRVSWIFQKEFHGKIWLTRPCCLQIRKCPSAKYHYPWPVRQRVLLNQTPVSHQLPVFCIGRGKKFTTAPSSSSCNPNLNFRSFTELIHYFISFPKTFILSFNLKIQADGKIWPLIPRYFLVDLIDFLRRPKPQHSKFLSHKYFFLSIPEN